MLIAAISDLGSIFQQARSLMPLADEAASKLLVKEGPDGTVKFDNPAVGDFQVLDALVEVSTSAAATKKKSGHVGCFVRHVVT